MWQAFAAGRIMIKKDLSPAQAFLVMVHEAAHEILHHKNLDRPESKTVRETEAEAVAFVVCQAIGLDSNTASSDYIQIYDGKKETLLAFLDRIHQTASQIITAIMNEDSKTRYCSKTNVLNA